MFWIVRWWRKRQREIDLRVLWPALKDAEPDLERAKIGFLLHARIDPAWQGYTDDETLRRLD